MTYTFAELAVTEATYNEIAAKLRAAGYDHAFVGDGARPVIDMHGIGLLVASRPRLLRLVGQSADDRVQHAADVVYELAITHMVAGLRIANRLRGEAGQPALSLAEIMDVLELTP